MRWILTTGLVFALAANVCLAETPDWSSGPGATAPMMQRARMFGGQNWWTRYGEAVNSAALSDQEPTKADGVEGSAPPPMYGDGYVFGLGACECPPPCVGHLWDGYVQHPKRCDPFHGLFNRCGDCCGDSGCGKLSGMGKGCGCGPSCTTKAACGCAEPVTCTTKVSDCGCKPVCGSCQRFHLSDRWKGCVAHWHRSCDSCSAPIGCGCATPVDSMPKSEKQATTRPPIPLPEDAALFKLPRMK
jgi:hypothetical protein